MNKEEMLEWLDKYIEDLPEDEKKTNPKKTCANCYNNCTVLLTLGFYWARQRCRQCNNKDSWSNIESFRKEIANKDFK